MSDFIRFHNLVLRIRVVGTERQVQIAYVLLEGQTSVNTLVAHDTIVLGGVGLQTAH